MLRWHLRKQRVRRFLALSPTGELPEGPGRVEDAEGRELLQRLYRVLERLPVEDRTAYFLRHVEGLKLEEVAESTGSSLATVKRRLLRASRRLEVLVRADSDLLPFFVKGGGSNAI
jgi:RNA polymerase sigma-70 factor (ECF subfamily)